MTTMDYRHRTAVSTRHSHALACFSHCSEAYIYRVLFPFLLCSHCSVWVRFWGFQVIFRRVSLVNVWGVYSFRIITFWVKSDISWLVMVIQTDGWRIWHIKQWCILTSTLQYVETILKRRTCPIVWSIHISPQSICMYTYRLLYSF